MSYMIERVIIYAFCAILLVLLLMGCATPPYVCQEAQHESGQTAILCMPIKPEQVIDTPARRPMTRPGKPDERT